QLVAPGDLAALVEALLEAALACEQRVDHRQLRPELPSARDEVDERFPGPGVLAHLPADHGGPDGAVTDLVHVHAARDVGGGRVELAPLPPGQLGERGYHLLA